MANVPGTEQPSDESDDGVAEQESAPEVRADSADSARDAEQIVAGQGSPDQPWPTTEVSADASSDTDSDLHELWPRSETQKDGSEPSDQIRRTDADRWAASFAGVSGRPEPPSRLEGADTDATQEVPVRTEQPSWSNRVPMPAPPAEPSWRNAGSTSGWGQPPSVTAPSTPTATPPARSWTTDVPSGFSWSSDTAEEPVGEHVSASRGALARSAQAIPSNPPPPPPPPSPAYPGPPPASAQQQGAGQTHVQPTASGQHGTRQSAPSGSQSQWWANTAAAPTSGVPTSAVAPQQWHQPQPQQPDQQEWQPAGQQVPPPGRHMSAADLTSGSLVKPPAAVPRVGWRKVVHAVTGGTVNPGLSQAELHRRNLIERITAPVRGCHRIAVVSLKGGIGKTTTTSGLGLTLAEHRGDRVVALDANPDAGTLAERLTGQVDVTVRDLLDNVDSIRSFTDVSSFTSLAARLQVLASEQDPEMSEAFSEAEYRTVADVLARYFNIVLTDSGTGLLHSAMSGTLAIADSLVVVGSPSVDGASRASKTLDWLIAHGHGELVSRAVAVISTVRPASKELDMVRLRDHFLSRVRAVIEIPYDRHLVTGGIIDMTQLDGPTEQSFLELSATVADGFRLPPVNRDERASGAQK